MQTAAEMLYCEPDIACFAKLMTGGIIPLAATLASEATFEAFTGDSKVNMHLVRENILAMQIFWVIRQNVGARKVLLPYNTYWQILYSMDTHKSCLQLMQIFVSHYLLPLSFSFLTSDWKV